MTAVYKHVDETNATEYRKSSKSLSYTPLGPPHPPKLRANGIGMQSVTIEWFVQQYPRPEFITGYRLIINSELKRIFEKTVNEFIFTDMMPGKVYEIQIITLTNSIVGQSKPSNPLILVCPQRPSQPLVTQLPTVRPNSVVLGWKPTVPRSSNKCDQILLYK